jgi:gluconolactonase
MHLRNQNFILRFVLLIIFLKSPFIFAQEVEKVDDGFQFTEGPVWKDGALYFSDIQGDKIYKWSDDSGTTPYRDPSGRSNGLTLDLDGNIVVAGHSARHVARLESPDSITILASHYDGKKFNSPNDIVVKSDSSIFFTDPLYGLNDIGGTSELGFCGIYRISPSGKVQLLDDTFSAPNGICFSPDESMLYVSESDPSKRKIYVWDVVNDSTITNKRIFVSVSYPNNYDLYLDGMKVDADGRLYSCSALGVVVYNTAGVPVDTIEVPNSVTNCNWGDEDGKTLYITATNGVYKIRINYTSISNPERSGLKSFRLHGIYPNPFNPSTTIRYELSKMSRVDISIYNLLGQKIDTLISEQQAAGPYKLQWQPSGLSSDVYICQISAEGFSTSRKMILMK